MSPATPIKEELLYDYSSEPLWDIFCAQNPELGCLKRNQIRAALIAAGIDCVDVVTAFDEIDRNRDNLITYEEFRHYVGVVKGDSSLLDFHSMTGSDETRLEVFKEYWEADHPDCEKIELHQAIESIRSRAT